MFIELYHQTLSGRSSASRRLKSASLTFLGCRFWLWSPELIRGSQSARQASRLPRASAAPPRPCPTPHTPFPGFTAKTKAAAQPPWHCRPQPARLYTSHAQTPAVRWLLLPWTTPWYSRCKNHASCCCQQVLFHLLNGMFFFSMSVHLKVLIWYERNKFFQSKSIFQYNMHNFIKCKCVLVFVKNMEHLAFVNIQPWRTKKRKKKNGNIKLSTTKLHLLEFRFSCVLFFFCCWLLESLLPNTKFYTSINFWL